jgi:hypothetical protein
MQHGPEDARVAVPIPSGQGLVYVNEGDVFLDGGCAKVTATVNCQIHLEAIRTIRHSLKATSNNTDFRLI